MNIKPYQVVEDFEHALCEYTGAKYAVTTTSCTTALLLACSYWHREPTANTICIPRHTYVGVPQSILHAGFSVEFRDEDWVGGYELFPLPIWDYARRFTSNMYVPSTMQCVSFHWSKILNIGQGGAILHDNDDADKWFRRMRFDGRTQGVSAKEDVITEIGYHAYMSPRDAAEGLSRLAVLPYNNDDLPVDDYPDLSKMQVFYATN